MREIRVPIGMSDVVVLVGNSTKPRQPRIASAIRGIVILLGSQRAADRATRRILADRRPVTGHAARRGFGERKPKRGG